MLPHDLPDTAAPGPLRDAARAGPQPRATAGRGAFRSVLALVVMVGALWAAALALVAAVPATAAVGTGGTGRQDPGTVTSDASTPPTSSLLVPGDGTPGAEATTTTTTVTADGDDGLSDQSLVILVIVGLLVVALLVGVLTWRYWVATRPEGREPRRRGR